jgi:hypothetical protein
MIALVYELGQDTVQHHVKQFVAFRIHRSIDARKCYDSKPCGAISKLQNKTKIKLQVNFYFIVGNPL